MAELETRVGSSSCFRLTVFCYHFCLNAFPSSTKYVSVLLILFGHVFDMNLLLFNFIALLCTDCTLVVVHVLVGTWCAERFNCSINDLIYSRLPIIINSYVRNSVDETTLDCVGFLRELIMIRDNSLTLSGLLSSDELTDVMSHVCLFVMLYSVRRVRFNNK